MSSDQAFPETWFLATLGELGTFVNGDRGKNYPSKDVQVSVGVPFINAGHLKAGRIDFAEMNYINEDRFDLLCGGKVLPGDILYCLRGSLGKAALVGENERGAIASSLLIIRPFLRDYGPYIYYFLVSPLGLQLIRKYDNGTAQPNLSARNVERYTLPFAPELEQQRIVQAIESYLTRLDDAVATLKRVERNLERYRASVLKSAIEGRLVPTEAALAHEEGRDYEPASALLELILAERRRRWSDSGNKGKYQEPTFPDTTDLPALPEGWCWASVDQLASDVRYGSSSKTQEDLEAGVPVLRMGNIINGYLNYSELKYLPLKP